MPWSGLPAAYVPTYSKKVVWHIHRSQTQRQEKNLHSIAVESILSAHPYAQMISDSLVVDTGTQQTFLQKKINYKKSARFFLTFLPEAR